MANVFFKRGTQANFNNLTSWQEGAFYLTTDTQRLYYSDGSKAVQVNPGITTVANVAGLPATNQIKADDYGQFYYCAAENILAIYNGSQWVQINSAEDTFVDERIVTATANEGLVSISDVLYQNNKGDDKLTSNIEVTGANGLTASVVQKYVKASGKFRPSLVNYYTESNGVYTKVNSPSASNLSTYYVEGGYQLVLSAPVYKLDSTVTTGTGNNKAVVTLSGGGITENNTVTLEAGSNLSIAEGANGEIVLNAADGTTIQSVEGSNRSGSSTGFDIKVTMSGGDSKTGSIDPIIRLKADSSSNNTDVKFSSGIATLPVYTKTEVDKKIQDFNAMEYKGTLTSTQVTAKLSSQSESNGWVYMLSQDAVLFKDSNGGLIASGTADQKLQGRAGDLIVVQGTENASGVVTNPTFVYIPSGNEKDTTYTVDKTTHGITIKDSHTDVIGGIALASGDDWVVLNDTDGSTDENRTVTLKHKTVTPTIVNAEAATQTGGGELAIPVQTVEYDGAGHISKVTNKTYNIVDTHATIEHTNAVSATGNVASVADTVKVDSVSKTTTTKFASDNLTVSANASTGTISMNLEWGSF